MCGKEVDIDFSTLLFHWEFVYIVDSVCVLTHCVCLQDGQHHYAGVSEARAGLLLPLPYSGATGGHTGGGACPTAGTCAPRAGQ